MSNGLQEVAVILVREADVSVATQPPIPVKFEVGPLTQVGVEEWECACAVTVATKRVSLRVTGIDSLQATLLAVRLLRSEANSLLDRHPSAPKLAFGPTLLLARRRSAPRAAPARRLGGNARGSVTVAARRELRDALTAGASVPHRRMVARRA